jgi:DNA-binding response OmpR family regulator
MKKRILVIENDLNILELINIVLEDAGYKTLTFQNQNNLFRHVVDFQPDAVILDIIKPTPEGTELCEQIKAAETTSHIPVIVLSTHPRIEKVKEICADEVVHKPFNIDGLLEVLQDQLRSVS